MDRGSVNLTRRAQSTDLLVSGYTPYRSLVESRRRDLM
jgi:hypothetical protein